MRALLLLSLSGLTACGSAAPRVASQLQVFATPLEGPIEHDRPVPDSEQRDNLSATVDLPPAADCEERFDVELYQHRGVDIIIWDERRGCVTRGVAIRHFPRMLSREELTKLLREKAQRVIHIVPP